MSKSVDERVVEMRFDNAKFERNVQTSLGTLDKLKSALNFDKSQKNLEGLQKTAEGFDFSKMADNIQTIANRFTTFGIVGDQVIRRITDAFLGLGSTITKTVNELSIEQIGKGWEKYADKTAAVQTIMAATAKDFTDTGEQMEYVNSQLDKLNWFTDETSYNFLDMVNNIGKFTSNAVELDTAVTAMQGISTWAAISGANTQEASRAMYNLSQAISVGSVKLMDWKSIENANMATFEFKQTAIETAVELGTLTKGADGLYRTLKGNEVSAKNFNSALSDAWFSSDVLLKTLDQYGGFANSLYDAADKTGMTASELLRAVNSYKEGNLDIAKISRKTEVSIQELDTMFKELSNDQYDLGRRAFMAAQEAKTFKEAIDSVKDAVSTGWMNSFELIFGNYEEAKVLWTNVANGLYDIFAAGAEGRVNLLKEWHNSTIWDIGGLTGYEAFSKAIDNILQGLVNLKDLASEVFSDILPGINVDNLLGVTKSFYNFSEKFKTFFDYDLINPTKNLIDEEEAKEEIKRLKELNKLENELKKGKTNDPTLVARIEGLKKEIAAEKEAADAQEKLINKARLFQDVLSGVGHFINLVRKGLTTLKNSLSPLKKTLDTLSNTLLKIGSSFGKLLGRIDDSTEASDGFLKKTEKVADFLSKWIERMGDFISTFFDLVDSFSEGNITLKELADKLGVTEEEAQKAKDIFDGVVSIFNIFKKVLSEITDAFPSFKELLKKIGGTLSSVARSFGLVSAAIDENTQKVGILKKILDTINKIYDKVSNFLIKVSEKIKYVAGLIGKKLKELFNTFKTYAHLDEIDIFGTIFNTGLIAGVITIVSKFMKAFDEVKETVKSGGKTWSDIGKNINGVLTSVSDSLNAFQSSLKSKTLLKIAEAIAILSVSLWLLSSIDSNKLATGLVGLSLLFGELFGMLFALNALTKEKGFLNVLKTSQYISSLSKSLLIMAVVLKILSTISIGQMGVALLGLLGMLGGLIGFLAFMQKFSKSINPKNLKSIVSALEGLGLAMLILSIAMKVFSTMSWEGLAKGGAAFIVILAAFAGFAHLTKNINGKNLAIISASLILMSVAIIALTASLAILALIGDKVYVGVLAIGALLAILAAFGAIADKAIAGFAIAAGFLIVAASAIFVVSIALLIFVGVLSALSKVENIWVTIGALAVSLLALAVGLAAMSKSIPGALALTIASIGLMAFAASIKVLSKIPIGSILKALLALAAGIAILFIAGTVLSGVAPALILVSLAALIFAGAIALLGVGVALLANGVESAARAIVNSLRIFLVGFINLKTEIFGAIVTFVDAFVTALIVEGPKIAEGLLKLIDLVLYYLVEYTPPIVEKLMDFLILLIDGLNARIPELIDSLLVLLINLFNGLANGIRNHSNDIINAIDNIIGALIDLVMAAVEKLVSHIPGLSSWLGPKIKQAREDLRKEFPPQEAQRMVGKYADSASNGIKKGGKQIDKETENVVGNIGDTLSGLIPIGEETGEGFTMSLAGGMTSSSSLNRLQGSTDDLTKKISGNLDISSLVFKTGENVSEGYAKGLESKKALAKVEAASKNVGDTSFNKLKNTLQVRSPSRLTEQTGKFFDLGYANGMYKHIDTVEKASGAVADASLSSMSKVVSKVSDMIESDIDPDPVIRPVLDLTDIENGANRMNRIFTNQNGIAIGTSINPNKFLDSDKNNNPGSKNINYGGITITINAAAGQNPKEIAKVVMERMQIETEQRSRARA